MPLQANYLVIPLDNAIATYWRTKFPDLEDVLDVDDLYITISPGSYRPVWEAASTVEQGYSSRFATISCHRLEAFDINLGGECNRASLYYLLKDLEAISKDKECGKFVGITIKDYLLPDLDDIKDDLEYSERQVMLEAEQTAGSMGLGGDRAFFGTRLMFQLLDPLPEPVTLVP